MSFILTKKNSVDNRNEAQINEDNAITRFYFTDEFNMYSADSKIKNSIKINIKCENGTHEVNFNGYVNTINDSDVKRILIANGYNIPAHFNEKIEYEELSKIMKKPQKNCLIS